MRNKEFIRMSKGQSQSGTQSRRRALERCKSKGKTKNVVYVDVENEKTPDIILIDAFEVSQKGSRELPKYPLGDSDFISIDDDEVTLDETENCSQDNGATSTKCSYPANKRSESTKNSQFEEFQFASGKRSPVKFSKSRRTYSGKTFSRNRFGLSPLYDSSSSDDEDSDCELMEGSSGKIRELWERAASKKRAFESFANGHPNLDEEASGSGSFMGTTYNFEVGENSNCNVETPFCFTSDDSSNQNNDWCTSPVSGAARDSFRTPQEDLVEDSDKAVDQHGPSWNGTPQKETHISNEKDNHDRGETFSFGHLFSDAEVHCDINDFHDNPSNLTRESEIPVAPEFNHEADCYQEEEVNLNEESVWFNYDTSAETVFNHDETVLRDEDVSMHNTDKVNDTHVNYESPNADEVIHQSRASNGQSLNSRIYEKTKFNHKGKPILGEPSMWSDKPCGKMHVDNDLPFSTGKDRSVLQEDISGSDHIECESTVNPDNVGHLDNEEPACDNFSSNFQQKGTPNIHASYSMDEREPFIDSSNNISERNPLCAQNENGAFEVENNIICGREKLKETDEYKRAIEEEWASRQQQLQIQAEEAQKLRKRKRAEAQRLLDMERRQKERVEEMRETQKKNVETLNLKEQLRVEIRKELGRLELINTDMTSLLRALGINVGSGFAPTSHEVNAAYKQALLKFHPDRASKTDIRKQVEAEEKFKLISRLKDKIANFTTSKSRYF